MQDEPKIVSNSALPDDRPQVLKDKDYSADEVAMAVAVTPFRNERIRELTATIFDQWYVGSCVPHGFYTQLEYEGIVSKGFNQSQLRAYRKRSNYPGGGSIGADMYNQIRAGQSNDFPTPRGFTDAQANAMPYIAGTKLLPDWKYYQYIDKKTGLLTPEKIPADVAAGKAVAIFIYASDSEWSKEYVEATDNVSLGNAEVRHCVCIIPKGDFEKNGKNWLSVHDSARFGGRHLRYISEDFLMKRCYFAAKVLKAGEAEPIEPVTEEKPLVPCEMGDRGQNVKALQAFLVKEGKLESQYLTGYYGAITAKAVLWWQLENWGEFSSNIPQLLEWGGKYWGGQSIAIINK